MKKIYLEGITLDDFKNELKNFIEESRKNNKQPEIETNKKDIYGTRDQVSNYLKVSLPTIWDFSRRGILKAYKISGRVLYKWDEVESAIEEITPKKWR
jgi:hypothetical protein